MLVIAVLGLLAVVTAAAAFGGLWISSMIGTGFGFEDLRRDAAKCLVLGAVTVGAAFGLVQLASYYWILAPLPIVWYIAMKLLWPGVEKAEIAAAGGAAVLAVLAASVVLHALV